MKRENIQILNTNEESQVLTLIEKSFGYTKNHSYKEDFLPLFQKDFHPGSVNAYSNSLLVGHIGYCLREIVLANKTYPIAMLGGIAVDNNFRGQGIFKKLLNEVIESLDSKVAFFILWSGDNSLYENFNFHQCGKVYQWGEKDFNKNFIPVCDLTDSDLQQMKELYEASWPNRIFRSSRQWQSLKEMNGVSVYLEKEKNLLISYALKNKGFDLQGVVHEFASAPLQRFIDEYKDSKVWSPTQSNIEEGNKKLWLGLVRQAKLWENTNLTVQEYFNDNSIMIGGIDSI